MRRGDVWTAVRLGHERSVVIVGNDAINHRHAGVLVVPLSDVHEPDLTMPAVADSGGKPLGTFLAHHVGQVDKAYLTSRTAVLAPASQEDVDIALRAALDL
ncbi:type II toxin-antitoxin system PemK/MazF family toxin [Actinoplanes sp. NEAU-A12]|uniref:Type II toxin-antitoxin system PemK/MazF family toxin n=1 Tax=Actinoplanes sandaracinus TaxID=3045177 RepID=A0ABT6WVZ3_9ACTN|nr:type II toxin-antitoxin system PemK/MazF family toxin [Actinoplanes sandaracinus]MDI6103914.1 type II toxin-antitoxin system PemK/MazF family toxin [Actinoplanes sandaracinus]